jgi:hypothetical protein
MSCAATAMSAAVPGEGAPLVTWEAASIPAAGVLAAHFKLPVAILPAYPARGWMEVQEQRSAAEYQAAVRFNSIYLFHLAAAQWAPAARPAVQLAWKRICKFEAPQPFNKEWLVKVRYLAVATCAHSVGKSASKQSRRCGRLSLSGGRVDDLPEKIWAGSGESTWEHLAVHADASTNRLSTALAAEDDE